MCVSLFLFSLRKTGVFLMNSCNYNAGILKNVYLKRILRCDRV